MISKILLQERFVRGKFTMPVLLSCSLALWLFVAFCGSDCDVEISSRFTAEGWLADVVTLPCYLFCAFMLNSMHNMERRVNWLFSLFMWLSAVAVFIHSSFVVAFSLLVLLLSMAIVFSCQTLVCIEQRLFTAFAIMGFAAFISPLLLFLVPMFIAFVSFSNILTLKRLLAMILGVFTPFWIAFGIGYVYEPAAASFCFIRDFCNDGLSFMVGFPPLHCVIFMVAGMAVSLPALVQLLSSAYPSKPLLRKRMYLFLLINFYVFTLSFILPAYSELFYACSLPGTAVLLTYMFTMKMTKYSNMYFIFVVLVWAILAVYCLWMKLL